MHTKSHTLTSSRISTAWSQVLLVSADVVVEFDPITYPVDEGETADLRIVLNGMSALDVSVMMTTQNSQAISA